QLSFLERNVESDIGGNHILKNAKAFLWAGAFFTGPEAARWSARGARILERELPEQILADGVHFERSPAYHAQVTADLLECSSVPPRGPSRDDLERRLAEAARALSDLSHPDGMPGLFNDGGLHMTYPVATVLQTAEERLGRTFPPRPVFAFPEA